MKLDDILSLWKEDSIIDITELGEEAIKISKLLQKYYEILINEKKVLLKYENEMKILRLAKHEFFTQGHNEETMSKGWTLPAKGIILKQDMPMYLDADQDVINLSLKIGLQQEKVDYLDSIIRSLQQRGYSIKSAIEWHKFTMGG